MWATRALRVTTLNPTYIVPAGTRVFFAIPTVETVGFDISALRA